MTVSAAMSGGLGRDVAFALRYEDYDHFPFDLISNPGIYCILAPFNTPKLFMLKVLFATLNLSATFCTDPTSTSAGSVLPENGGILSLAVLLIGAASGSIFLRATRSVNESR